MNAETLATLAATSSTPSLTLFLPVEVGNDRANLTRLKSAVDEARTLAPTLESALDDTVSDLEHSENWDKSSSGLAVFVSDSAQKLEWLNVSPSHTVHCDDHFMLAPLMGSVDATPDHVVLALQLGEWRAMLVRSGTVRPIELPKAPDSLDDATLAVVEPDPGGSTHAHRMSSGGTGPTRVMTQGFGDEDRQKNDAELYFRSLDTHLADAVDLQTPLVVVGNEPWIGMFADQSAFTIAARVDHNPSSLEEDALLAMAADAFTTEPGAKDLLDSVRGASEDRRSNDIDVLAAMASSGGIDTFLMPEDGLSDPATNRVLCQVLSHGGSAHTVPADVLEAPTASLRWPAPPAH